MDASQNPVSLDVPSQIGVAPTQMDPESQESPTQPETPAKDRGHSVLDMLLRSPPSTKEMLDVTLPSAPPGSSSSAAPMEEDAPLAFSTPPRKKQRDGEGARASPSLDGALSPEAVSPEPRDTFLRRRLRRSFPAQGQSPSSLSEPTPCPAVKHDPYMPTPLAGAPASSSTGQPVLLEAGAPARGVGMYGSCFTAGHGVGSDKLEGLSVGALLARVGALYLPGNALAASGG